MSAPYTRDGYRRLLRGLVAAGYRFSSFADRDGADRVCLLRHDVDADLGAAAELARIEADERVRSTFFVMLRSPLYNLFSRASGGLLAEIAACGHWFGLHYDAAVAPRALTHEDQIELESGLVRELLGVDVSAVSFHQPASAPDTAAIRPRSLPSAWNVAGFAYYSDANKTDAFPAAFASPAEREPRIQVLVHPLWWVGEAGEPAETSWDRALAAAVDRAQDQLLATERAYGPRRRLVVERT